MFSVFFLPHFLDLFVFETFVSLLVPLYINSVIPVTPSPLNYNLEFVNFHCCFYMLPKGEAYSRRFVRLSVQYLVRQKK